MQEIASDTDNDNTPEIAFGYLYDKVGNVKKRYYHRVYTDWDVLSYDDIYQLLTADYPATWLLSDEAFSFDAVGNWDNTTMLFSVNNMNQYTMYNSTVDYDYDLNGNLSGIDMTDDGPDEISYGYNAKNQLISAVMISHTCSYEYDYRGRRISKTVDSTTTKYAYDGDQVIAEYDGSDNLLRKFIYGPGIDEPICMVIPAGQTNVGTYWYHFDGLGSVVALSNSSGTIVEAYSYSAYGTPNVHTAAGIDGKWLTNDDTISGSSFSVYGNPYMFTGRRWDDETELYYYRARMYAPDLGCFLQPDPIGYDDGMNMYAYCGNNPLGFVDPYGLCKKSRAGLRFLSQDDAARAAMLEIRNKSVKEGVEYAGFIYKNWLFGTYYFGTAQKGSRYRSSTGSSSLFKREVAVYHSHGNKLSNSDENFSESIFNLGRFLDDYDYPEADGDINQAEKYGIDMYLVTPSGVMKKYAPSQNNHRRYQGNKRIGNDPIVEILYQP